MHQLLNAPDSMRVKSARHDSKAN